MDPQADDTISESVPKSEAPNDDDEEATNPDAFKAFLSRIPTSMDDEHLHRILTETFGKDAVKDTDIAYPAPPDEEEGGGRDESHNPESMPKHKGFAFVTFSSVKYKNEAVAKGTIRVPSRHHHSKDKKKKHRTIYIGPVVRGAEHYGPSHSIHDSSSGDRRPPCFLWASFRCPYGEKCQFAHEGEGGAIQKRAADAPTKKRCFSFWKKGKCKAGESCPFRHVQKTAEDGDAAKPDDSTKESTGEKPQKDCINWKTKGKCRKGERCPYRHDEAVGEAALQKKARKKKSLSEGTPDESDNTDKKRRDKEDKERQPLSIRVFGMAYATTEEDIREYFVDCGKIVSVTFPTFEDSGRSKGFCGILFTSPKAVEKAVELDGRDFIGRWLSIQPGKMYLRQWEENLRNTAEDGKRDREENDEPREPVQERFGEFGQKVKKRKKHGFAE